VFAFWRSFLGDPSYAADATAGPFWLIWNATWHSIARKCRMTCYDLPGSEQAPRESRPSSIALARALGEALLSLPLEEMKELEVT
jgi:hypothetical protein